MAVKKTTSVLKKTPWPWLVPVSVYLFIYFTKKYLLILVKTTVEDWSNVLIKQLTDTIFLPSASCFLLHS